MYVFLQPQTIKPVREKQANIKPDDTNNKMSEERWQNLHEMLETLATNVSGCENRWKELMTISSGGGCAFIAFEC